MLEPYYSCDLEIPIVRIEAKSKEHAEAIMQEFIDKIAEVMDDKVRWDDSDWEIQKNVYSPEDGVWYTE
jgi:hypothetical protein